MGFYRSFAPKTCVHLYIVLSIPNLQQLCTASAEVNRKSVLKQMQYRFAVNFENLNNIFVQASEPDKSGSHTNINNSVWNFLIFMNLKFLLKLLVKLATHEVDGK